jgi:hypothetical protein
MLLFCYITNPIVCLFCDEEGELPEIFSYWQTWDDSCNPRFYIVEKVPSFLRYDYDKHYEEWWGSTAALERYGRQRCFARLKDPHFTIKERIQRYICRVMWLTRNCAYGFAFFVFGKEAKFETCVEKMKVRENGDYLRYGYDKGKSIFTRAWWFKFSWHYNNHVYADVYLGWKIDPYCGKKSQYSMIAHRPAFIKFHF